MTARQTQDRRIWQEWLTLYLDHCRRELSPAELAELAQALEQGADGAFAAQVTTRVATVSRPLVDFIATAPSPLATELVQNAVLRLRACADSA